MSVSPEQEPYVLSEKENQIFFLEEILPDAFDETAPAVAPKAFFLGGQSGSGKSELTAYLLKMFSQAEGAVVVNSDALREYHPDFPTLQRTNVNQASFLVNPDTVKWQQKLIAAVMETRCNVILDGTLGGNPAPIQATMQRLREASYYLQISVLAVPARLSRLGIYKRYEDQIVLKEIGRWVGMENHDRLYDEIPKTLTLLETEKAIDEVQIFRRPTGSSPPLLYQNSLQNGQWQHPPTAETALAESRNRPWTAEEQNAFLAAVQTVAGQRQRRGVGQGEIANFCRYVECTI